MTPRTGGRSGASLTDGTIDHVSVLVRVILHFAPCRRVEVDSGSDHTTGPGRSTFDGISEMGDHDPFHDSGHTERYIARLVVHIQAEEAQPNGEGKTWE